MSLSSDKARTGFTIVECLIVVVVISVVISVTLPALRAGRATAQQVTCLSRLGSILRGYAVLSNNNRGHWANYVPLSATSITVEDNGSAYGVPYFGQVRMWAPALEGVIWEQGDSGESLTCPAVYRESEWLSDGRRADDLFPYTAAMTSYYYSAALISQPALWEPAHPEARQAPDLYRAKVGMHQVTFPADKVAIAETAAHHADKAPCYTSGSAVLNAGSADGHAETRTVVDGNGALIWSQPAFGFPDGVPIPFSSSPHGAGGRDN